MAFYTDNSFSSAQGRAFARKSSLSLPQRMRLPVVTIALGAIAALVIAAGALDWLPVNGSVTSQLSEIEYMIGTTDQTY
ncbi:hypothetical protein EDD53_0655 [Pacificibacter maritimus]|uniref:Uncharacterized protein n=1 Tax=Pacificibacter maritimus TaxID=762213 RepID=A0A3N4US73_9RHOB|nr:hypothetical protein [Pacificibacter maritimus]RPE71535.1 hypothetical protein EDD53_0655 [Pacificibacter maritimus]